MKRHSSLPSALALLVASGLLLPTGPASAQTPAQTPPATAQTPSKKDQAPAKGGEKTPPVIAPITPETDLGTSDAEAMKQAEEYESSLAGDQKDVWDKEPGEKRELHLSDAVAQGIENNLQLQVERFDPLIAWEGKETAWGAYDPLFSTQGGYDTLKDPNTNKLFSTDPNNPNAVPPLRLSTYTTDLHSGLDALIPWLGASLNFTVGGSKTDTEQFAGFSSIRPFYETDATLTARLPLLKGLVWNGPWTLVKTSQTAYQSSEQGFRANLMDVVQDIETRYWDLVAQKQAVLVAEKSLETAKSLLDQTQTQYEVGVKSKVEVVEAEAGVAAREFDLIVAVNRFRHAEDVLIDAVYGTQLTPGTHLEIVPADDPENYVAYQIDTVEAAQKAFRNRPELQQAEALIQRREFELKFAKNQRLPQFDVIGSYGVGARRGANQLTPTEKIPLGGKNPFDGNLGDTYGDWGSNQGRQEYSVRGVISIPIGNVAARHTVSMQQLELRKAKTNLAQLKQQIILQVRNGARNLASAQEGIEAANRRVAAASEQLRAERVRLEYGESTPFRVLQKESDLVEAENEKITALYTYRKSVVDLHRAQGTTLLSRNIVVEEAAPLR